MTALAARKGDANAPARKLTLEQAAKLDPDAGIRRIASAALTGGAVAVLPTSPPRLEVAWLRLAKDDGTAPGEAFVGSVVRADGIALPIAFDAEGFAVIGGLPPGEARLVLAPRIPR